MHWTVRLRRWWQRNFGHVYLTETRWNGETACNRIVKQGDKTYTPKEVLEIIDELLDGVKPKKGKVAKQ